MNILILRKHLRAFLTCMILTSTVLLPSYAQSPSYTVLHQDSRTATVRIDSFTPNVYSTCTRGTTAPTYGTGTFILITLPTTRPNGVNELRNFFGRIIEEQPYPFIVDSCPPSQSWDAISNLIVGRTATLSLIGNPVYPGQPCPTSINVRQRSNLFTLCYDDDLTAPPTRCETVVSGVLDLGTLQSNQLDTGIAKTSIMTRCDTNATVSLSLTYPTGLDDGTIHPGANGALALNDVPGAQGVTYAAQAGQPLNVTASVRTRQSGAVQGGNISSTAVLRVTYE